METKYFAMAALMFGLAACSNDEPATEGIDDSQPVVAQFIGCIDKVQSRADGVIWDANESIGITGGEYTNIKYLADTKGSDRHFSVATEGDEIYFKEKKTVSFMAYHPYAGEKGTPAGILTKTITATDQEGIAQQQIDFMFGKGSGNKSAASVELNLQHKMSQVILNFKSGGDDMSKLTSYTIKNVKMSGQFDTADGTVEVMGSGTNLTMNPIGISGKSYSKSLILYPQRFNAPIPIEVMWDGQLISGELKVEENSLKLNSKYICDITVSKEGLEVSTITGEWNDVEDTGDAEESVSDDAAPQVGDFYYADGTWSGNLKAGSTCIGIVFKVGAGNGEENNMGLNKINGYVIALNNTSAKRQAFAQKTDLAELKTGYEKYVGYSTMYQITKRADFSESAYWGCYSALNYSPIAPASTSGWYLPSLAEFIDLCSGIVATNSNDGIVETNLKNAGGTKMRGNGGGDGGVYWSVSKKDNTDSRPAAYDFGWNSYKPARERIHLEDYSKISYARPVLAF